MIDKNYISHEIIIADDLSENEKFEALEVLEHVNDGFAKSVLIEVLIDEGLEYIILNEAQGDDDVAAYLKHRNKLKKVVGQKQLKAKNYGLKKGALKAAPAKGGMGKKVAAIVKKKHSLGSRVAAKLKSMAAKYMPKAAKAGKLVMKAKMGG